MSRSVLAGLACLSILPSANEHDEEDHLQHFPVPIRRPVVGEEEPDVIQAPVRLAKAERLVFVGGRVDLGPVDEEEDEEEDEARERHADAEQQEHDLCEEGHAGCVGGVSREG